MADDTASDTVSAADAVKARRGGKPSAPAPRSGPPSQVGIPSTAPAQQTLVGSFVAGATTSEDYVRAVTPAFHSWYPRGARQPSTVLLWNAGQLVERSHYELHGGDAAPAVPEAAVPVNEPGGGIPPFVAS